MILDLFASSLCVFEFRSRALYLVRTDDLVWKAFELIDDFKVCENVGHKATVENIFLKLLEQNCNRRRMMKLVEEF